MNNHKIRSYAYITLIPDSRYARPENKGREIDGMSHRVCRGEMNGMKNHTQIDPSNTI